VPSPIASPRPSSSAVPGAKRSTIHSGTSAPSERAEARRLDHHDGVNRERCLERLRPSGHLPATPVRPLVPPKCTKAHARRCLHRRTSAAGRARWEREKLGLRQVGVEPGRCPDDGDGNAAWRLTRQHRRRRPRRGSAPAGATRHAPPCGPMPRKASRTPGQCRPGPGRPARAPPSNGRTPRTRPSIRPAPSTPPARSSHACGTTRQLPGR
jgi:hypothetical protein